MRNSPNTSVMEPVSIPPARSVSSCLEPVVMEISSLRRWCISVAVVKPIGTSLLARYHNSRQHSVGWEVGSGGDGMRFVPSAISLSAFASEMPLIKSS